MIPDLDLRARDARTPSPTPSATFAIHTIVLAALLALLLASPALAVPKWSCGEWKKDPSGKCEEVRTCTRTVCDPNKIDRCWNETRTECVKSETKAPTAFPWISGSMDTVGEGPQRPGRFEHVPAEQQPRLRALPR